MEPETLIEAVRYFSDLDTCNQYMRRIKWPDGKVICPHCQSDRIGEITTRRMLRCRECRKQFSYKVGTIFEASSLGLDKWFVALWSIANCKNGISSHELGRALGVTQKTAWFMLHRIRHATADSWASSRRIARMAKAKKPGGWKAFDELARKIVRVPKEELEKRLAERKPRKRRK